MSLGAADCALVTILGCQGHTTTRSKRAHPYLLDAPAEGPEDARLALHLVITGDSANKDIRVAINLREPTLPTGETQNTV